VIPHVAPLRCAISPAVFLLALEQIKRGSTAMSLCSLLAAAGAEVEFGPEPILIARASAS